MRNRIALIAFALILSACGKEGNLTIPETLPKADKPFPVVAWHGVRADHSSAEQFQAAEDMGITLNYTRAGNLENAHKLLKDAASTDIKVIIECSELYSSSSRKDAVKDLMKYPALGGYFCKDEPVGSEFPTIATMMKDIQAIDKKHLCYSNLFPTGPASFINALGYRTYEQYVNDYLKQVPVTFLSFDCYPIVDIGGGTIAVKSEWYGNLETCASKAERAGLPLWAFMLTVAHYSYPIPTIDHLRLQAYSDLAYGAQTLQCFTYWTPEVDTGDLAPYRMAPMTADGVRTETYDVVKQMISEVNSLAWIFKGAVRKGTWHLSASGTVPDGTRKLSAPLTKLESVTLSEGGQGLVSVLTNHGYTFLMFQNTSATSSVECTLKMSDGAFCVHKDGSIVSASEEPETATVGPGDVRIYMWI